MSTILTETSTFTATVTAPDDGDSITGASVTTGLQSLANRTKYLNDTATAAALVAGSVAMYSLSGTGVADGDALTLAETYDINGNYTLSGNTVTVPAAGYYLVSVCGKFTSTDASADEHYGFNLKKADLADIWVAGGRFSATVSDFINLSVSRIFQVTVPASEAISVTAGGGSGDIGVVTTLGGNYLTIQRIA